MSNCATHILSNFTKDAVNNPYGFLREFFFSFLCSSTTLKGETIELIFKQDFVFFFNKNNRHKQERRHKK